MDFIEEEKYRSRRVKELSILGIADSDLILKLVDSEVKVIQRDVTINNYSEVVSAKNDAIHELQGDVARHLTTMGEQRAEIDGLKTILRQKECLIKALVHYLDYLEEQNGE